jgi:hypothetical protein
MWGFREIQRACCYRYFVRILLLNHFFVLLFCFGLIFSFLTESYYIAQAGLKLTVLLLQPLEYWVYTAMPGSSE